MLELNTTLQNRYQVLSQIGKGGMGAVYLAKDLRLGSLIALKETLFTDEVLLKAFEREARLLANLRHATLPRVSDHFAEGEGQFLVMEYIEGDDLATLLDKRGRPFSPEEVSLWADQLLDALDYLHSQNPPIVHRDIKPQNLKLTGRGQIVLLDFGLAKGRAGAMTVTGSNQSLFGYTPSYAPLEQIQSSGTDPRSDLYSLAATLYHLATNIQPADAMTRATAVLNNEADPLAPANELNPFVPEDLSSALMRAMSLNRKQRPSSASEMRRGLRQPASTNYIAAGETKAAPQDRETVALLTWQTGIAHQDAGTQAIYSPDSQPTVNEAVLAPSASVNTVAEKSASSAPLNWVATFNRKWAIVTMAIIIIAGGTAITMVKLQRSNVGSPMPPMPTMTTSPDGPAVEPPPAQSDADSSTSSTLNGNQNAGGQNANRGGGKEQKAQKNGNTSKQEEESQKPRLQSPDGQSAPLRTRPARRPGLKERLRRRN